MDDSLQLIRLIGFPEVRMLQAFGLTDAGPRKSNEDAFLCEPELGCSWWPTAWAVTPVARSPRGSRSRRPPGS